MNEHAQSSSEVLSALGSPAEGLAAEEARQRQQIHGPNVLPRGKTTSWWSMLLGQFLSPIAWVLLGAGILALVMGRFTDAGVVLGAVIINALMGFIQEWKAHRAIASLSTLVAETCTVIREGKNLSIPSHELVPGDMVLLQAGDKIPADLRLCQVKNLHCDEASLTGESVPVAKHLEPVAPDASLGDRTCLAFAGSLVTQGTATGVVVRIGAQTELGRINALLQATEAIQTPLSRQLAKVSLWITIVIVGVTVLLTAWGIVVKHAAWGDAALVGITLAVAAIPEGLPAIITIALALGVRNMARRHAVVRHLPAVETLGSTSVICSDKTGTLTRGEMTIRLLWCEGQEFSLQGVGYEPHGALSPADSQGKIRDLLTAAVLCNDAGLNQNGKGHWTISGDPTEAALVVAARKIGLDEVQLRRDFPRNDVLPFDSDTKYMATRHTNGMVYLKGAPEIILPRCKNLDQQAMQALITRFASQGLRILAIAQKNTGDAAALTPESVQNDCRLMGLVGMIDPPRQEAIDAIARCHRAGITVKMITGDHHATAHAIGVQLGLCKESDPALTGRELDALDAQAFATAAKNVHVFARVSPEHKIRLVEALQAQGAVVAMTGDGVNDAPALKRADIGVAMGITGTAVSKDAAVIVLMDDNFASIAAAVEEGRRVYDNLVKSLAFLLPTNLGLAFILAFSMFFFPTIPLMEGSSELLLPLSPTQILWINLVASITLSLPIAFEHLERSAHHRPPRPKNQAIFSVGMTIRTFLVALAMAAAACGLFLLEYHAIAPLGQTHAQALHQVALAKAQTMAVMVVIFFQIFYLFACRGLSTPLWRLSWTNNPVLWLCIGALILIQIAFCHLPILQNIFHTADLSITDWLYAMASGAGILILVEATKLIRRPARRRTL